MTHRLSALQSLWATTDADLIKDITEDNITDFEQKHRISIPTDLQEYFLYLNGSRGEYDDNFFRFYPLDNFLNVRFKFEDWIGMPYYKDLNQTLFPIEECFVFADYLFHSLTLAIHLYKDKESVLDNYIYCLCGGKYKIVAKSFTEF
ncbi:SMI1/KNR4 family protein [Hymenobacter sp. BT664]|uniref:SMI1/KNR4 family protein n=1 Tax=Hymenobacter montanus TaxID=2771359 RepID=A0A927GJQ2_9BACT|nr:SMI1/KNR4 family protein [Hymenobacter montanus]MBD2768747.1 SMI1/KNR4 family protein [Hymenobacter montanus]